MLWVPTLSTNAHAAEGVVPVNANETVQVGQALFSRPADFRQVYSQATGQPVYGRFEVTRRTDGPYLCQLQLVVKSTSIVLRSDITRSSKGLQVRLSTGETFRLQRIEQRGRGSGGRWYESRDTSLPLASAPVALNLAQQTPVAVGAAVLPDRIIIPQEQYGVLLTAAVATSVRSLVPGVAPPPIPPAQEDACAAIARPLAAPTVRRVLRHARLAKGFDRLTRLLPPEANG